MMASLASPLVSCVSRLRELYFSCIYNEASWTDGATPYSLHTPLALLIATLFSWLDSRSGFGGLARLPASHLAFLLVLISTTNLNLIRNARCPCTHFTISVSTLCPCLARNPAIFPRFGLGLMWCSSFLTCLTSLALYWPPPYSLASWWTVPHSLSYIGSHFISLLFPRAPVLDLGLPHCLALHPASRPDLPLSLSPVHGSGAGIIVRCLTLLCLTLHLGTLKGRRRLFKAHYTRFVMYSLAGKFSQDRELNGYVNARF